MQLIKNLLAKYGHTIVQGIVLAGQAYLLVANGGKLTAANYIGAVGQLLLAQHARQSEPQP